VAARISSARRVSTEMRRPWWVSRNWTGWPVRGCGTGLPGERCATIRSTRSRVSSSMGTIRSVSSLPSGTFNQAPELGTSCTQSSSRSSSSPMRIPVARSSSNASARSRLGEACSAADSRRSASGGRYRGSALGSLGTSRANTSLRPGASAQPHSLPATSISSMSTAVTTPKHVLLGGECRVADRNSFALQIL